MSLAAEDLQAILKLLVRRKKPFSLKIKVSSSFLLSHLTHPPLYLALHHRVAIRE